MTSGKLVAVLVVLLATAGGILFGVKLRRDSIRSQAFRQLQSLGFRNTISSRPNQVRASNFVAPARQLTEDEFETVLNSLEVIRADHDIEFVDFSPSSISEQSRMRLQKLLPRSDVRYVASTTD